MQKIHVYYLFYDLPLKVQFRWPPEKEWGEMSLEPEFDLLDLSPKTINRAISSGCKYYKHQPDLSNILIVFWNSRKCTFQGLDEFKVIN